MESPEEVLRRRVDWRRGGVSRDFGVLTKILFPHVTDEIMLMRAFGTAAFLR